MPELEAANDPGDQSLAEPLTLARRHRQAGRMAEAGAAYRQVLDREPGHAEALHFVGYVTHQAGEHEKALSLLGQAIAGEPEVAAYRNDLALVLWTLGRADVAARELRLTLALRPGFAEAWLNLGNARRDLGEHHSVERCYRRVVSLDRRRVEAWTQMSILWIEKGELARAESAARGALTIRPTLADAHYNLALALLAQGRWAEGWPEFEWRLRVKAMAKTRLTPPLPRWDERRWTGEPAKRPRVLVHAEQGLGDTIMFARFAPMVAALGWTVRLAVQPELVGLLGEGLGHADVGVEPLSSGPGAFAAYAAEVPLMSLPSVFKVEPGTIPVKPYLRADPRLLKAWGARLAREPAGGLTVGLVWAGNPRQGNPAGAAVDRRRSLPLERLAPLGQVPGVRFVSVQTGEAGVAAGTPPAGLRLIDLGSALGDFRDTAALLQGLDLLITVDTAAVHLAGALGRPVWLLNRFDTDWRWLQEGSTSPWYPSLRIYRQKQPGDWRRVIARVAADLATLASGR